MPEALAVIKGTLAVLVLKALTWQPMHGFEITWWLEARSRKRLALEDASIYQTLYRLEKSGRVKAEWGVTDDNERARYYHITAAGRAALSQQTAEWLRYADIMSDVLLAKPTES